MRPGRSAACPRTVPASVTMPWPSGARDAPPPTWPPSSTPPGPRAAPRDASSRTRTCSPTCATRSVPCRRSSPCPARSALLFLPLAHSFARIIQVGCLESGTVLGHTPDAKNLVADLGTFQPTFILAVPRVFEKVYSGAELQASASPPRAASSRRPRGPRSSGAKPWASRGGPSPAAGPGGCGPRTPCSTGSSTASCARRSAGGSSTPCPAAPRSASGSGTSSAASASPCWRATA